MGFSFPGVSPLAMELHPFRVPHPNGVLCHRVFRVPHPNGVLRHSPGQRPGIASLPKFSRTLKGCNTFTRMRVHTNAQRSHPSTFGPHDSSICGSNLRSQQSPSPLSRSCQGIRGVKTLGSACRETASTGWRVSILCLASNTPRKTRKWCHANFREVEMSEPQTRVTKHDSKGIDFSEREI